MEPETDARRSPYGLHRVAHIGERVMSLRAPVWPSSWFFSPKEKKKIIMVQQLDEEEDPFLAGWHANPRGPVRDKRPRLGNSPRLSLAHVTETESNFPYKKSVKTTSYLVSLVDMIF
jgi:hypothetical protein